MVHRVWLEKIPGSWRNLDCHYSIMNSINDQQGVYQRDLSIPGVYRQGHARLIIAILRRYGCRVCVTCMPKVGHIWY